MENGCECLECSTKVDRAAHELRQSHAPENLMLVKSLVRSFSFPLTGVGLLGWALQRIWDLIRQSGTISGISFSARSSVENIQDGERDQGPRV